MNFTIYNNINNNRNNINYVIKSHKMLKTRIQVGGTTPRYNPTILINVSTISNITLMVFNYADTDVQCPRTQQVFPKLWISASFMSDTFIREGE
jgi:hypothetical protein